MDMIDSQKTYTVVAHIMSGTGWGKQLLVKERQVTWY